MAAELDDICTRLAAIERQVEGVERAFDFDDVPNTLKGTYLPCFINVPGPATYEAYGGHNMMVKRLWRLMLFVTPVARPSDVAAKAALILPFFRRVPVRFASAQQLDDLAGVEFVWIGADDGLDVLEYATAADSAGLFAGIEFRMEVTTTYAVTMAT